MKKLLYLLLILPIAFNNLNAADETILLETTGVLSVQGAILTQIALGTTFDAWTAEVYSYKEFEEWIGIYQEAMIGVRAQLYSLYRYGNLHYEDTEFIDMLIALYDAMLKESNSMLKYSYSKKNTDFNQYMHDREIVLDMMDILFE